ncbi:MAG: hypothetical protein QW667_04245 [Candidatus Bathyarchaeia archaeon]
MNVSDGFKTHAALRLKLLARIRAIICKVVDYGFWVYQKIFKGIKGNEREINEG